LSSADKALADKAKANGTLFQSRADATQAFQQKYASNYTSRFSTEPSARPDYIPRTTVYDNRNYNVIYDPIQRGYGYYIGSRWYWYDAFMDTVMLDSLMHRHYYCTYPAGSGYGYATAPGYNYSYGRPAVYYGSGTSWVGTLLLIVAIVVVLVIIGKLVSRF